MAKNSFGNYDGFLVYWCDKGAPMESGLKFKIKIKIKTF